LRFVDDGQVGPLRHALSDFNHRCRNLLNGMKMSFYLAKRSSPGPLSERWGELDQTYRTVEQLFERLSTIYRNMPLSLMTVPFGSLAAERSSVWREWFEQAGNALTLEPPECETAGQLDAMRLVSAIDGFVAWRAASMPRGGRALLNWSTDGGCIELVWREHAPEAPSTEPADVQRPSSATMGSLSLPLLARVVAEHRGRVTWSREPRVEARVRWPLVVAPPAPRVADDVRAVAHR
jgi:hypothetical protein